MPGGLARSAIDALAASDILLPDTTHPHLLRDLRFITVSQVMMRIPIGIVSVRPGIGGKPLFVEVFPLDHG